MQSPISAVGFIMDGNRRWAKAHGQPTMSGHLMGYENFYTIAEAVLAAGIPHAVFYAFSTENWHRSREEVGHLLEILNVMLGEMEERLAKHQVRVRFIGRREDFTDAVQAGIARVENASAHFTRGTVWIALSYGGRAEIIAAVNAAIETGLPVTEDSFSPLLWSAGLPDPELIIRTGGEERLSNFLTWQSVYSELFFTDTYWPAFTPDEFAGIVSAYGARIRRHGQ